MILPSIEALRARQSRERLIDFVKHYWPVAEPGEKLVLNWHHEAFCDAAEAVASGEIKKLIVNLPAGFTKSMIWSVMFHAWVWANRPDRLFLMTSYSRDLTIRDGVLAKRIMESGLYAPNWNGRGEEWQKAYGDRVSIVRGQDNKVRYDNTATGWRLNTMMGGEGTGYHPDFCIGDDLLKEAEWNSTSALEVCIQRWDSTFAMRLNRDPAFVIIGHRLAILDPSGVSMRREGWETICFPMHYARKPANKFDERRVPDPRDKRTIEGELLWPERFNAKRVKEMEEILGPQSSARLDQNPIPAQGVWCKRSWFAKVLDVMPNDLVIECRGWDPAGTAEKEDGTQNKDATAGIKLADMLDGKVIVTDMAMEWLESDGVDELMKGLASTDGKACIIREERVGLGKAMTKYHAKELAGYDYAERVISGSSGDKLARLGPFFAQCRAGNVYLLRGAWNRRYVDYMMELGMPGRPDDVGDGTSCAYNGIVEYKETGYGGSGVMDLSQ